MGRRNRDSQRMNTFWERSGFGPNVLTQTQAALVSFTFAEQNLSHTLMRTRGNLLVSGEPTAADDTEILAFGLVVANEKAITAGGSSLPGPIVDAGSDAWLWHRFVVLDPVTATAGDPQAITLNERIEIDAKAMRRISADQGVVLMAEKETANATVTVLGGIAWLFGER